MKIKMLNNSIKHPTRGTEHSAGIDLRLSDIKEYKNKVYTLGLGVAVEIPDNHFGMLAVRSSWGAKGITLTNGVGIIDSDYRGELMMKVLFEYRGVDFPKIGDRIAQIIIMPYYNEELTIEKNLNYTERGSGSYGSTDN